MMPRLGYFNPLMLSLDKAKEKNKTKRVTMETLIDNKMIFTCTCGSKLEIRNAPLIDGTLEPFRLPHQFYCMKCGTLFEIMVRRI